MKQKKIGRALHRELLHSGKYTQKIEPNKKGFNKKKQRQKGLQEKGPFFMALLKFLIEPRL